MPKDLDVGRLTLKKPNPRYIDAEELKSHIVVHDTARAKENYAIVSKWIDSMPEVKLKPVNHSWWDHKEGTIHVCHACMSTSFFSSVYYFSYCPYCGSKMDGEEK